MEAVTVALVSLLAAISPGPDFFIVLKNSLSCSRKNGIAAAFGVSAALVFHLTYSLVGIGMLTSQSPFISEMLQYFGALYLCYIGTKGLINSFKVISTTTTYTKSITPLRSSFMQGFLTNLLNPKCAFFFISFFSQFITPATPLDIKIAYGCINWSISFFWFLLLAWLLTSQKIQEKLSHIRIVIDRIMGSTLVLLGLKLLFV